MICRLEINKVSQAVVDVLASACRFCSRKNLPFNIHTRIPSKIVYCKLTIRIQPITYLENVFQCNVFSFLRYCML